MLVEAAPMSLPDPVAMAVPVFVALILLELAFVRLTGKGDRKSVV